MKKLKLNEIVKEMLKEEIDYTGGVSFDTPEEKPQLKKLTYEDLPEDVFFTWDDYFEDREGAEMVNARVRDNEWLEFVFDYSQYDTPSEPFEDDVKRLLDDNGFKYNWDGPTLQIYKPQPLNEVVKRLQKLAGILTR